MPSLNEIIYNIKNIALKGKDSRTHDFSDRNIAYWAKIIRNDLVYKTLRSEDQINKQYEQDFGCLPLRKVDAANCNEIVWGENLMMITIPKLLDLPNNGGLTFFGLVDKVTRIHTSNTDNDLDNFSPYKRTGMRAIIIGQNVYVRGNNEVCFINVRGIADDPMIVSTCGSGGEVSCPDWDTNCYAIPSHLESYLYDNIFNRIIGITSRANGEVENKEKVGNGLL